MKKSKTQEWENIEVHLRGKKIDGTPIIYTRSQKEIHFTNLALEYLPKDFHFYCMEDSNKNLHFSLQKGNIVTSVNVFYIFMEDSFFLEHLQMQIDSIQNIETQI